MREYIIVIQVVSMQSESMRLNYVKGIKKWTGLEELSGRSFGRG